MQYSIMEDDRRVKRKSKMTTADRLWVLRSSQRKSAFGMFGFYQGNSQKELSNHSWIGRTTISSDVVTNQHEFAKSRSRS